MDLGSKQEGREVFGCREKSVRETSREREKGCGLAWVLPSFTSYEHG